jgi:hypothetical protein
MSELAERGNELVSHISRLFEEYTEAPDSAVSELEDTFGEYVDDVSRLEETATQAREIANENTDDIEFTKKSLWDFEDAVMGDWDPSRPRFEERSIVDQIDDLEDDIEDATPGVDGGETTLHDTVSPLEEVTGFDEREALENLTSNQQRARKIALDIPKIATSAEAGYVIKSKKLNQELTKMMGRRPNNNDTKRVRDFLDDLGKNHVDVVDHRGEKMIVVEKAYARSLGEESYAPEDSLVVQHPNHWRDMAELRPSGNPDTRASGAA